MNEHESIEPPNQAMNGHATSLRDFMPAAVAHPLQERPGPAQSEARLLSSLETVEDLQAAVAAGIKDEHFATYLLVWKFIAGHVSRYDHMPSDDLIREQYDEWQRSPHSGVRFETEQLLDAAFGRRLRVGMRDAAVLIEENPRAALKLAVANLTKLQQQEGAPSDEPRSAVARIKSGGAFIFDAPGRPRGDWGLGDQIVMPADEAMMVAAPIGVGKTTLAENLLLRQVDLRRTPLLGLPVAPARGQILYIAADRPAQIQASLKRMVTPADRAVLDNRVVFWEGPPPYDAAQQPMKFVDWVEAFGELSDVYVDSLKDIATAISRDEPAGNVNRAFQELLARGIRPIVLNHTKKMTFEHPRPSDLNDVFGSTWIAAGMGSVLLLWGKPGDPVLEVGTIKHPQAPIGPLLVSVNFATGELSVEGASELRTLALEHLRWRREGKTAQDLAARLYGELPSGTEHRQEREALIAKARRLLDGLVRAGLARREGGDPGGGRNRHATVWFAVEEA